MCSFPAIILIVCQLQIFMYLFVHGGHADNTWAMMIALTMRGKTIRTVPCCIACHSCDGWFRFRFLWDFAFFFLIQASCSVFWLVFLSLRIFCVEFFWLLQGRLLIPVQQIVCEGFCPKCECLTHVQSRDLHEKNVAALCGYGTNLCEQEWHEICDSGCHSCSNATVKSQFVLLGPVLPTFTQNLLEEMWHRHTNKVIK